MASTLRGTRGKVQPGKARRLAVSGRPERTSPKADHEAPSINTIRYQLAIMITALLVLIALLAAVQTNALAVLQILLPLIGTMFGFFFGYKVGKM